MSRDAPRPRLDFIDALRGLVIVLMALDHVRDFWGPTRFDPTDLTQTEPLWFFTRWVTHFCAPIFVFLAGAGAYFYGEHRGDRRALARFLCSRGLWLIALELTVVNLSWSFAFNTFLFGQVIWALGWSMIALAGLIYLPRPAIAVFALAMIGGHNLLDGLTPADFGVWHWLWAILHVQSGFRFGELNAGFFVAYPLIPWIGVMAAGYVAADWIRNSAAQRVGQLVAAGLALWVLFLVLRLPNLYGEPVLWSEQARGLAFTIMSVLNVSKYPPSLQFLCITLGGAFLLLALFSRLEAGRLRWLVVFGRVPMFFYLLHLPLIHGLSSLYSWQRYGVVDWQLFGRGTNPPPGYEPSLLLVYGVWAGVVWGLYFACRWYAELKRRRDDWWLKYL